MNSKLPELRAAIEDAAMLRHRLVLVFGPSGSGKSTLLRTLASEESLPCLNVSARLSRQLLERTPRQRRLEAANVLRDIVRAADADTVLLDHIDLLFEPDLKLDPLQLLKSLSRHTTLAVAWGGQVQDGEVIYAEPEHEAYFRRSVGDVRVVSVGEANGVDR